MGDLTRSFSWSEFTASDTAERLGIENTPLPAHEAHIRNTLAPLCQRIRDKTGRAIHIMSGYRNPEVNKAVGGVSNSAHALGYAADIVCAGMTATALAKLIAGDKDLMADIDQLILETSRGVVHVAAGPQLRGQIRTQPGAAGTQVVIGIV